MVLVHELHHLLKREILVLRYMQRLDGVILEVRFLPTQNIFQEVNGDVI